MNLSNMKKELKFPEGWLEAAGNAIGLNPFAIKYYANHLWANDYSTDKIQERLQYMAKCNGRQLTFDKDLQANEVP